MKTPATITIEGFVDLHGDFDIGIYIVKPAVISFDGYAIDNAVEDYCIDLWDDHEMSQEDSETRRYIQNTFYRIRKKDTEWLKYWRRVIEIYTSDDERVYREVERTGYNA